MLTKTQNQFTLDLFSPAPSANLLDTHDLTGRWVLPEITALWANNTGPEEWAAGVIFLERPEIIFYSLEELEGATIGR